MINRQIRVIYVINHHTIHYLCLYHQQRDVRTRSSRQKWNEDPLTQWTKRWCFFYSIQIQHFRNIPRPFARSFFYKVNLSSPLPLFSSFYCLEIVTFSHLLLNAGQRWCWFWYNSWEWWNYTMYHSASSFYATFRKSAFWFAHWAVYWAWDVAVELVRG